MQLRSTTTKRTSAVLLAVVLTVGVVMSGCERTHSFGELELRGAPAVVTTLDRPVVLAVTSSWETFQPLNSVRKGSTQGYGLLHLDVWSLDANDLSRKWVTRLASLEHTALDLDTGLLGVHDGTAWLIADGLMAVALSDGHVIGDAAAVEARNPPLKGLMPSSRRQIYFDDGLVIIAADGRRWRIDERTLAATPDTASTPVKVSLTGVPQGRASDARSALPLRLRAQPHAFKARSAVVGDSWYGLMHVSEVEQQRRELRGQSFATPLRYRLWSSPLRNTIDRFRDPVRVPLDFAPLAASREFLQGGLLTAYGRDGREAVVALPDPVRFLVLHQDRVDAAAVQTLSCIGLDGKVCWDAPLGISAVTGLAMLARGRTDEWGIVVVGEAPASDAGSASSSNPGSRTSLVHVAVTTGKTTRLSFADVDLRELARDQKPFHRR